MGLDFSGGSQSGTTSSTSSGATNKTFGTGQTALQDQLGTSLSKSLSAADSGTLSPGVLAGVTQTADKINKTASGGMDRISQFLAARGLGKSGVAGKAGLENELARQGAIGDSTASAYGRQDQLNQGNLLAALNYAFTQLGATTTASQTGASEGSQFGWDANAHVPFFGN